MSLLIQAISELRPGCMFTCDGENYSSIQWSTSKCNDSLPQPSENEVNYKIEEIKKRNLFNSRKMEYPTAEQWILAYIQKELDNDSSDWDNLVELRTSIKNKYPI